PADCESLAHGERCSCANGEANQHERGYDAPDREASLFGLPLATQLSLDAQIRLKNGLRDCFGLLLFHVPAFLISGLTPELRFFSQLRGERRTADPAELLFSRQQNGAGRGRSGLYVPAGWLEGLSRMGLASGGSGRPVLG